MNVYWQREALGAAFRLIPTEIKTLEELGIPSTPARARPTRPRGLVLVTGPTGSGKSTTLAALIDEINRKRAEHILTIEDPIEFVHRHKRCVVNQREIGVDATSFAEALRAALRQDPDVILLGEMRDLETISTALTAAETGHLVFATLHTQSAPGDDRPRHRRLPGRAAGPDPDPARRHARRASSPRRSLPTADGTRPRAPRSRSSSRRRRPEPDPPGEGRAGLLGHADRHRRGHADDGAVARRPDPARRRSRSTSRSRAPAGPSSSSACSSVPASTFPAAASRARSEPAGGGGVADGRLERRRSCSREEPAAGAASARDGSPLARAVEEARCRGAQPVAPVPSGRAEARARDGARSRSRAGSRTSPGEELVAEEGDLAVPAASRKAPKPKPRTRRRTGEAASRRRSAAKRGKPPPGAELAKRAEASRRPQDRRLAARGRTRSSTTASPSSSRSRASRSSHGIIVGGELREPELLADALRAFFRKHKLPRQGVRLGIANNRIGVRIFEIAGIDDPKQLENAIRFRAQEALPIPIEEAVLDYHVLGERVDDEGNTVRRVLLVVAYRELIDRYVAACKKAGIRLSGIDLEAFALLRALGEPLPADDAARRRGARRRLDRPRPLDLRRLRRPRLRVHARARLGRLRRSTSRSRASSTARPPRPSRSSASSRSPRRTCPEG